MQETSARLLRVLSLLQTRREWTGDEMAERLGVTTRTVRRDVDKLRSLGYPVPVVGNAGRRDLPMAIEYSAGLGPAARALARHVGAVQYVTPLEGPNRNLSGARLLVIVGD